MSLFSFVLVLLLFAYTTLTLLKLLHWKYQFQNCVLIAFFLSSILCMLIIFIGFHCCCCCAHFRPDRLKFLSNASPIKQLSSVYSISKRQLNCVDTALNVYAHRMNGEAAICLAFLCFVKHRNAYQKCVQL